MAVKKGSARRGRERRGSERADARLSMRVEAGSTGTARIVTESQNISSSGVYCLASHYLAPLSKVQLTIVLPRTPGAVAVGQEFVKCDGIVVRCDQRSGDTSETPYELACMFTGLDRDLRQRIEEFVTWRNLQALRAALSAPEGKATKPSSSRLAVKQAVVRKAAPARASARNGRASTASARRAVAKRTAKPARKAAVNAAKPSAKSTGKQAAKASAGRARR